MEYYENTSGLKFYNIITFNERRWVKRAKKIIKNWNITKTFLRLNFYDSITFNERFCFKRAKKKNYKELKYHKNSLGLKFYSSIRFNKRRSVKLKNRNITKRL